MTSQDDSEPKVRKHIWLYSDDCRWVKEYFGSTVGESKAYRIMIRKFRRSVEARAARSAVHVKPGAVPGLFDE